MALRIFKALRCKYKLTVTTPGGLICLDEKRCGLKMDHEGPHQAQDGTVWMDDPDLIEKLMERKK
jgi:hypothetical protein